MACVNADGTVTASARSILAAAQRAASAAEISTAAGLPLYRVRSSLRELVRAGLLRAEGERYILTEDGRTRLSASEQSR
ncbi:MAG: hypothetical protein IMW89_03095 [Ktedonobacteraceae bacterium]|nr:hypothetical protein [Ktedonobacteraceae bacterium]